MELSVDGGKMRIFGILFVVLVLTGCEGDGGNGNILVASQNITAEEPALVNANAVEFEGVMADWSRSADNGNINAAKFCPVCGNRIYHFNPAIPETIKLKPANLSDTSILNPTTHLWVSEKQDWFTIPEGVTVFDKQM